MFLSTTQREKEQRALQTGRKDKTKAQMRWERALPHIPGKFAEFLPYLHCSLKSVQRSQPAVPGKRITFNNQHVFQSKLMLLAAMSPAPRCSCNCPLQHRAVAKQLWQAGFLRAGLPHFLEQWARANQCHCHDGLPQPSGWNRALEPLCQAPGLWGGEAEVCWAATVHTVYPGLSFIVAGKFQICSMHRFHNTHAITNLFSLQESALGLCQYAEHFR